MISRVFSSALIAAFQHQTTNISYRSATHLHKCAAWALNTSHFFSDGSVRRTRKTKRKSSLTKRVVDAVAAYKEIYGNLEMKHRYLEIPICGVAQFLGSVLVLDMLSLSRNWWIWSYIEQSEILIGKSFYLNSFIVPKEVDGVEPDSRWPKVVHGLKLGTRIGGKWHKNELSSSNVISLWSLQRWRWSRYCRVIDKDRTLCHILVEAIHHAPK